MNYLCILLQSSKNFYLKNIQQLLIPIPIIFIHLTVKVKDFEMHNVSKDRKI